jgi:hypothetical protein
MQFGLLLKRPSEVTRKLEAAMLHHYGRHAYYHRYKK